MYSTATRNKIEKVMRVKLLKPDLRFTDVEKATLRGLSCTEIVRMQQRCKGQPYGSSILDTNLLRDIGLDRRAS